MGDDRDVSAEPAGVSDDVVEITLLFNTELRVRCPECEETFSPDDLLDSPVYQCPECDEKFLREDGVGRYGTMCPNCNKFASKVEHLCHGWAVVHSGRGHDHELLALRIWPAEVPEAAVPLFGSGEEAAAHGKADIEEPGEDARVTSERLRRKHPRLPTL